MPQQALLRLAGVLAPGGWLAEWLSLHCCTGPDLTVSDKNLQRVVKLCRAAAAGTTPSAAPPWLVQAPAASQ
jgi:hypothetical protein